MIDVMLSKATEGMLLDTLLKRIDKETKQPLFMAKAIPVANNKMQLMAIIPNRAIFADFIGEQDTAKEQEEVLIDYLNLPGQEFPDFELCVDFFGDTHYSPESIDKLAEELEWMTESDYAMWRMMAKVSFEPTVSELIKTYKARHPRSQPFSITCCERSELLCKSHPLISVHKQFAFI